MANFRQIHTKIWKDPWFIDLPPERKLLFIYLFSNEQANMMGLYQLPLKVICFETDLDQATVEEGLAQFAADGKCYVEDNWVWLVNLFRYNANNPKSPKTQIHILKTLDEVPDIPLKARMVQHYSDIIPNVYPLHTPCIPVPQEQEQHQEQEQEQEQEREQEHEQEHGGDAASAVADALESIEMGQIQTVIQEAMDAGVTHEQIIDTCAWARDNEKDAALVRAMFRKGEYYKPRAPAKEPDRRRYATSTVADVLH